MILAALALAAQSAPLKMPGSPPETYVSAQESSLPDPQRSDHLFSAMDEAERLVADDLNKSLDLWTACHWEGGERDAAIFATWSRTHLTGDRIDPKMIQVAWQPYGHISAIRSQAHQNANVRSAMCASMEPDRTLLMEKMDRQAAALVRIHQAATHR